MGVLLNSINAKTFIARSIIGTADAFLLEQAKKSVYIDNWMHVSPQGSFVALSALRTYLNWLPLAYRLFAKTKMIMC